MIKFKKDKKGHLLIPAAMLLLFGMLTTSTGYASNTDRLLELKSQPTTETLNISEDGTIYSEIHSDASYKDSLTEDAIVSEGFSFSENTAEPEVRFCFHKYDPRTYYKHTDYIDGSCTTDKHSSEICVKCGTIKVGALESTAYYRKCPH